jgi:hypothetical protein
VGTVSLEALESWLVVYWSTVFACVALFRLQRGKMLTHCSFKKSSMGLMLFNHRAFSVDIPITCKKRVVALAFPFLLLLMLMLARVRRRVTGSGPSFCRCTRACLP